jgi:serine phosphatase RsbU (regulator of sigma subunit)
MRYPPDAGRASLRSRPVLAVLAVVFAAATVLYCFLWIRDARRPLPPVELGFDFDYQPSQPAYLVRTVNAGSPAAHAGLLVGDRIIAVAGRPVQVPSSLFAIYFQHRPGDPVQLTVARPDRAEPVVLTAIFRQRSSAVAKTDLSAYVASEFRNAYPIPFVVVGLVALFLHLGNRDVWLLALLFASFATIPGLPNGLPSAGPVMVAFAKGYQALFLSLLGPLFYWLFAVFPTRSPIDLRVSWLKWVSLAFAYAVVKHQVLEIPVLLRRSARYLMVQRGFTVLLSLFSIGLTLLFASWLAGHLQVAAPAGIATGAVFGTVLLWSGSQVHGRVSGRIDRAFFRKAYDARIILEDLAVKTGAATGRGELAALLERHLTEALQPRSLAVYLAGTDGRLATSSKDVPERLRVIASAESADALAPLEPDCVTPVHGRNGHLLGLLVLGPRLSEEPYSGEDQRLVASVASQAGTVLENIRLAEEIAARMESERRAAREMEIAKEVQAGLLPQGPPPLETLECAARCIQARSVGGDYYDFLDLGAGRTAFILADVSGKGVHAALLMANLQAYLRSQIAGAPLDPARALLQVNRMLWKSTAGRHYATLFFGIYEDRTRRFVYVNCGHNPPVWLRANGDVAGLAATATVVGLFEQWECSAAEICLAPGDLLAVFSDGLVEATRDGEEFGDARLTAALQARAALPSCEIVDAVLAAVQDFGDGPQSDDLTLLVVRGR